MLRQEIGEIKRECESKKREREDLAARSAKLSEIRLKLAAPSRGQIRMTAALRPAIAPATWRNSSR